jgi:hypothetical protein
MGARSSRMKHEVLFEPAAARELNEAAEFFELELPGLGSDSLDVVEDALLAATGSPATSLIEGDTSAWPSRPALARARAPVTSVD